MDLADQFRKAIAPIAARAKASPSLFDFYAAEDVRPPPDLHAAFNAGGASLETIAACVRDLRTEFVARFGEPVDVPPPPVTHPEYVFPESFELRTMLLDLNKLFDVTVPLDEFGGYLARVEKAIDALRPALYAPLRRYYNYVHRPK